MSPILRLALLSGAWPLTADTVLLRNGFTLQASRTERDGAVVRLLIGGGAIEIPAADVVSVEPECTAAVPPQPAAAATAPSPLTVRSLVSREAERHGLPAALVHSVAQAESAYQTNAVSPRGAVGVMQLMPATARSLGADPYDPEQNIAAGARLLRALLVKYASYPDQVRRALAAYNAGEGAVHRHNGVPPYRETRQYVERVLDLYRAQPQR